MIKKIIKKIIPKSLLLAYHKTLAILANIVYWFPSRKMVVIGVTGTKGKSSTVVMITRILEEAGYKVGSTNTIFFKIGDKEWANTTKQGMLGRLKLQKLLRKMARAGCTHAVIEVTSEGILQNRQWGIAFDVCVFTNLGPEHIESHGSYEKYRKTKELIFKNLHKSHRKTFDKKKVKKIIIANCDDKMSEKFLRHRANEKWCACFSKKCKSEDYDKCSCLRADEVNQTKDGVVLLINGHYIDIPLCGVFMAQNALLAIATARSLGVSFSACESALEKITSLPGRAEVIEAKRGFRVVIDYAHEPKSFEAIFETAQQMRSKGKVIAVFGATGGGRDASKRPKMGEIAAKYADNIILTTDDPYDDDPEKLAQDIMQGISESKNVQIIIDRRGAIKKALSSAQKDDLILLLGKGSEQTMAVANGKYIPWSDRSVVEELI
ncbi:UDP-N-acetylmuramyl-tripeptide synthetase [Patescibacteria group bacterium]|nr:UDP-N-acetylmuramyl-tripeptide synthetase [Patescibacteria group bacterium]